MESIFLKGDEMPNLYDGILMSKDESIEDMYD